MPLTQPTQKVPITIDDAPGPANGSMLSLLSQFQIRTMFFVEGEFVARRKSDLLSIVRHGRSLGLHTWDHPKLTRLSDDKIRDEFLKTDRLIQKLTGKTMAPHWRPSWPYRTSS